jgi:SAM-dependent methyltransferase
MFKKNIIHVLRVINRFSAAFGISLKDTVLGIRGLPSYLIDFYKFKRDIQNNGEFPISGIYPCLKDRYDNSGSAGGHYFHQDMIVAKKIYENNPKIHLDIGSRIDGFVAHVAVFRPIYVVDIRPQTDSIGNIYFIQQDFMLPLAKDKYEYCDSLSCLHAMEHFGLGRYGDTINYNGHIFGMENLYHLLKKHGKLYFSVPIGRQRIEFNAQRVFSVQYLLNQFKNRYHIDSFSFVDDSGNLHENVQLLPLDIDNNFGCRYGYGIFEMSKI